MYCPLCGTENLDGANFCESCGAALNAVQTPSADGAANPFAVGAQTTNASVDYDGDAPVVPSSVFEAWKIVFSKYFNGKGRASQTEFWYWQIFLFLVFGIPAIYLMVKLLSMAPGEPNGDDFVEILKSNSSMIVALIWIVVWMFIVLCPNINLLVRRVHDFNTTGWLVLLPFVFSKFSSIIQLIFGLIPGTKGPNKYGPRPVKRRRT